MYNNREFIVQCKHWRNPVDGDVLHALEGVLSRFPHVVGVLAALKFSDGVKKEVKSSRFEIILACESDIISKIINYEPSAPLARDLELRVSNFETNMLNEVQDLKVHTRGLETQNRNLLSLNLIVSSIVLFEYFNYFVLNIK